MLRELALSAKTHVGTKSSETPATTAENVTLLSAWSLILKSTTHWHSSKNHEYILYNLKNRNRNSVRKKNTVEIYNVSKCRKVLCAAHDITKCENTKGVFVRCMILLWKYENKHSQFMYIILLHKIMVASKILCWMTNHMKCIRREWSRCGNSRVKVNVWEISAFI